MSQEIITVFQLPFHKAKGIPYVLLLAPYGYLTFPQTSGIHMEIFIKIYTHIPMYLLKTVTYLS